MSPELKQAYKQEIIYQTKHYKSLQVWLRNTIILSSLGIALIIFGKPIHIILSIAGVLITIVSVILSLIIGLALKNGNANLQKIYNILEEKDSE